MRTLGYLLVSVVEDLADLMVWVWDRLAKDTPMLERDDWTDGT